jgi:hypothetical protein
MFEREAALLRLCAVGNGVRSLNAENELAGVGLTATLATTGKTRDFMNAIFVNA